MNKKEQFLINLAGQAYKTQNDIKRQKADIKAQKSINPNYDKKVDDHLYKLLGAIIIGLIAFVGVEPMRVIYRRNFGKGVINQFILGLCCLFFLVYGLFCLALGVALFFPSFKDDVVWIMGSNVSFVLSGLFYFFLAHYAFKRGRIAVIAARTNNTPHGYEGDSEFFDFLLEKGWSQAKVQVIIEPFFTVVIGVIVSVFFNVLAGLPLIACGLSMWVYMVMKQFFFGHSTQAKLVSINEETKETDQYKEVETD